MKLELVEEVPRVAGTRFRTKTLQTELHWDGVSPLPPNAFDSFRISYRTRIFRGPEGERWWSVTSWWKTARSIRTRSMASLRSLHFTASFLVRSITE